MKIELKTDIVTTTFRKVLILKLFSADLPESTRLHSLIFNITESLAVFRECLGDFSKQAMFFARRYYTLFWSFGAKIPAVA